MTFWQENYPFIKDVYLMRQTKMVEWMENVEKSISRIMADKVYTSAEFKRERDNFYVSWIDQAAWVLVLKYVIHKEHYPKILMNFPRKLWNLIKTKISFHNTYIYH